MIEKRIALLRKNHGLSQLQLAEMLHISASTQGMYEQGRRTPSVEMLVTMSQLFGVSLNYLITGSEFIPVNPNSSEAQLDLCPCCICCCRRRCCRISNCGPSADCQK